MSKYSSTNSDHNQKTMDVKTHEVLKLKTNKDDSSICWQGQS